MEVPHGTIANESCMIFQKKGHDDDDDDEAINEMMAPKEAFCLQTILFYYL